MLIGIEKVLVEEKPDAVLVEGDTNTVLAGALVAVKLGIKVGHVEAGLRSYDRQMPEEINRVLADHCSDILFAPTEKSMKILLSEGIAKEKIFVTGNTVVDAVYQNLEISQRKVNALQQLGLKENCFFLVTVHRQENVDNKKRFQGILKGLIAVKKKFGFPVIYPIHPRAMRQKEAFGLETEGLKIIEPLDYLNFLQLESKARVVLTDSGGVQEETCILKVPCVTLRYNTERPETLDVGSNILAGTEPDEIVNKVDLMTNKKGLWENPFGDGTTGQKIMKIVSTINL
jgi:UDP-N-acetylglucosamine 2-epimerase (non-hydrolysing)